MKTITNIVIMTLFLFAANGSFANTRQESPVRSNHVISGEQVKNTDSFMLAKGQYRSTGKPESSNC